ncbi:hypothetical protein JOF53_003087 [Crossiella equi]|uniref:DUF1542 domain-containing protein n=1 Tax=Crossiella equi TaxID=130796 RepID=A0ABS5ACA0_9PSEU|nr:hypothetical protein [Crossiella equi]MBP2474215.1 hypothetical protein [Crossiella equi]
MGTAIVLLILAVVIIGAVVYSGRQRAARAAQQLSDEKAEARRWIERLGGQVLNLVGTNDAARQALSDASGSYTAAGSQIEQATSAAQARLAKETAMEGLYYVRAARVAMDLDPGPALPDLNGQRSAGTVSEDREVTVEGHGYAVARQPSAHTPHYFPGGVVAGRPVPQGWYSEPIWKPARATGSWGSGAGMLFGAMFAGMAGVAIASMAGDLIGDIGEGLGDMGDSLASGFDGIGDSFDMGGFGDDW